MLAIPDRSRSTSDLPHRLPSRRCGLGKIRDQAPTHFQSHEQAVWQLSVGRLIELLTDLDQDVEITVRPMRQNEL
jgi:hypothetical protein